MRGLGEGVLVVLRLRSDMMRAMAGISYAADLMEPLGRNWKARRAKELALTDDVVPVLNKGAQGRYISGLSAYEQK